MLEDINVWMLPERRVLFLGSLLHLPSEVVASTVDLRDGGGALVAQLLAARGLLSEGALRLWGFLDRYLAFMTRIL